MKTRIRFVYNKNKRLNKNGEAPIYIEVAFDNYKRKYINTKIYLKPEYWDIKKKVVKSKHPASINTNLFLKEQINNLIKYEVELINSGRYLSPEILDKYLKGNKATIKPMFYDFALEEFYKERMSIGTFNKNRSILLKLQRHTPTLTFNELNYEYVNNIDNWLRGQKKITSLNTIANYHKMIKKYVKLAINLGYLKYEENPYNNFKVKKSPTTKINLTESELEQFMSCKINNPFVEKIKDMFLFSCYTGLRFSDIINLQPKHYDIKENEVTIIIAKMQKTHKPIELPLHMLFNGIPLEIFKKYYNHELNYLFGEPITNQYINRELKFIAKVAGIFHKELTFHMARHTFGSLLAEKVGDPYLIKDLMGHSDIKMSMEYIHSSRKGRNDKLKKVDW